MGWPEGWRPSVQERVQAEVCREARVLGLIITVAQLRSCQLEAESVWQKGLCGWRGRHNSVSTVSDRARHKMFSICDWDPGAWQVGGETLSPCWPSVLIPRILPHLDFPPPWVSAFPVLLPKFLPDFLSLIGPEYQVQAKCFVCVCVCVSQHCACCHTHLQFSRHEWGSLPLTLSPLPSSCLGMRQPCPSQRSQTHWPGICTKQMPSRLFDCWGNVILRSSRRRDKSCPHARWPRPIPWTLQITMPTPTPPHLNVCPLRPWSESPSPTPPNPLSFSWLLMPDCCLPVDSTVSQLWPPWYKWLEKFRKCWRYQLSTCSLLKIVFPSTFLFSWSLFFPFIDFYILIVTLTNQ